MSSTEPIPLPEAAASSPAANTPAILRITGAADREEFVRLDPGCARRLELSADELAARPFLTWLHPDDRAGAEQALASGAGHFTARHKTRRGEWLKLAWEVRPDAGGLALLGLLQPQPSAPEVPPAGPATRGTLGETLDAMARIVEAKNPGLKCSILLVDDDCGRVTVGAGPSLPAEYNAAVEGLQIGPTVGSCGTASYWNVPVIVEDIARDPLWRNLREAADLAGVAACWSHPVTATGGDVLGAMALYNMVPGKPTADQMAGLEIAARMVGLAVERDRLEDRLRQAAKMEALGVLAGGIAHDFNNILAAILGSAELMLANRPAAETDQRLLQEIITGANNATDLCNQMLAYAGRGATSVEVVECNALILELGKLLSVTLSKKAVLRYELAEGTPLGVLADRSQLRQVIMNLITNASDALGDETGTVVLASSRRRLGSQELEAFQTRGPLSPGEFVCLEVRDSGHGMPEETLNRIFDPFYSSKGAGRGLGLAAAKGIVLGHNGAIDVVSKEGSGTTFTILLPWVPLDEKPAQPPVPDISAPAANVLLADDEPAVRRTLCRMLEKAGYHVTPVADGQEALDVFRQDPTHFQCVLLDLSMPRLDGEETFLELRKISPQVQVILSSGFTEREILNRFEGQGLAAAVQKPTPLRVLHEKVAQAVRQARET